MCERRCCWLLLLLLLLFTLASVNHFGKNILCIFVTMCGICAMCLTLVYHTCTHRRSLTRTRTLSLLSLLFLLYSPFLGRSFTVCLRSGHIQWERVNVCEYGRFDCTVDTRCRLLRSFARLGSPLFLFRCCCLFTSRVSCHFIRLLVNRLFVIISKYTTSIYI